MLNVLPALMTSSLSSSSFQCCWACCYRSVWFESQLNSSMFFFHLGKWAHLTHTAWSVAVVTPHILSKHCLQKQLAIVSPAKAAESVLLLENLRVIWCLCLWTIRCSSDGKRCSKVMKVNAVEPHANYCLTWENIKSINNFLLSLWKWCKLLPCIFWKCVRVPLTWEQPGAPHT